MSIAPHNPQVEFARNGPYYLAPFDRLTAPIVARWATDPQELFWLAPSTTAPLTAAKVVGWAGPDAGPRLFRRDEFFEPLGYLELNPMPRQTGHYWLGHCVIRPEHRGTGLGRMMIDLVLGEAFDHRGAHRVSLMVFPDNRAAYHCYMRCGFQDVTDQYKYFAATRRRCRMVQMSIGRETHAALRRARAASAGSTP